MANARDIFKSLCEFPSSAGSLPYFARLTLASAMSLGTSMSYTLVSHVMSKAPNGHEIFRLIRENGKREIFIDRGGSGRWRESLSRPKECG